MKKKQLLSFISAINELSLQLSERVGSDDMEQLSNEEWKQFSGDILEGISLLTGICTFYKDQIFEIKK